MKLACTKALGQEGTGEGQVAGKQRTGKRRVLGEVGSGPGPGRSWEGFLFFPKTEKKSLTCFKLRGDMLRFSSLADCSSCNLENALGEGKGGKGRSVKRPLQ